MENERRKAWKRYVELKTQKYYESDEFLIDEMLPDDMDGRYGN